MKRRTDEVVMQSVLDLAKQDSHIKAVILNGSRACETAPKDRFQDFDLIYLVDAVLPYVTDRQWLSVLGEMLIMQTPDEMDGIWPAISDKFTYLMQFKDGHRIDLTLMTYERYMSQKRDSQSRLLLDKDNLLGEFPEPNDSDYLPKKPTEKEFLNTCNEFLWVSLYVAKGICRNELTYTKACFGIIEEQCIKLLTWYAGIQTDFSVSMGKYGKYLEKYLPTPIWNQFKHTYVDSDEEHMWDALFDMCDVFHTSATFVSQHYAYHYHKSEYENVVAYLKTLKFEYTATSM